MAKTEIPIGDDKSTLLTIFGVIIWKYGSSEPVTTSSATPSGKSVGLIVSLLRRNILFSMIYRPCASLRWMFKYMYFSVPCFRSDAKAHSVMMPLSHASGYIMLPRT